MKAKFTADFYVKNCGCNQAYISKRILIFNWIIRSKNTENLLDFLGIWDT